MSNPSGDIERVQRKYPVPAAKVDLGVPPERRRHSADDTGISIIFPVHNESFIIEEMVRNYFAEFEGRISDFELIVAEDGSTDDTKCVLERVAKDLPIRLILEDERKWYRQGIIDAIARATKPWIFLVDSDYQFAAIDFWRLEGYRDRYDIILGRKSPRKDPRYRCFLAWWYNFLLRRLFGVPYHDMDTGFRLIRRSVAQEFIPQIRHMATFTAELIVRAHCAGYKIIEVPVPHYPRRAGSTSIYYVSKLFGICFRQFMGVLRLRSELKRRGLLKPTSQPSAPIPEDLAAEIRRRA